MAATRLLSGGTVDWAEVRRRVEEARRVTTEQMESSPERMREVLEERARLLARSPSRSAPGDEIEVVTFALANELYAVESRYVFAVFPLSHLSPLPGAEPPVCGITVWRGELLTMLDLRPMLGVSTTALNDLSRVIVLGEREPAFGVLTDAIRDLARLPAEEVGPSPDSSAGRRYLRGITREAMIVLEASELLRVHGPGSSPADQTGQEL